MKTPVETFLAVLKMGGRLENADNHRLRALLPLGCQREIKDAIRDNKPGLLRLLDGPPFFVVRSDILQPEFLLWVAADHNRNALISLGAPPGVVYTHEELRVIVECNPDANVLSVLHKCKRVFSGLILSHCPD